MARFIVVPQWQGSPSPRAMSLIDGAEAIAGDLPSSACHRVEVPVEAGESLDTGVLRASTLRRVAQHTLEELDGLRGERLIVVGGDSGVAVPALSHLSEDDGDIAVIWFSARAALHSPESSPTGAYASMALRAALGEAPDGLRVEPGRIAAENVILAGARDLDIAEEVFASDAGIALLPAAGLAEAVTERLAGIRASRVYLHIELDVLDPAHIDGVSSPQPFGVEPAELIAAISAARAALPLAGASLAGFAPRSAYEAVSDMGTILRIIGALAKG